MNKITFIIVSACFISIYGCSVLSKTRESQLYSIAKEEKRIKGILGKKKVVTIRDFRQNEVYDEDMAALKDKVESYILLHPDLNEQAKNNLRELKVSEGSSKEEVKLLLGEPVKISRLGNNPYEATELWVYRINKINIFTVFIIPVFLTHEGYYLYFKDNILSAIERRYLQQTIHQGSAPGVSLGGEEQKKTP